MAMFNFKLFEIKEGKFKVLPTVRAKKLGGFILISIITIIIVNLSGALKVSERDIWKLYNLLVTRLGLQQELPDIRDHEKQLDAQIELEVDKAIRDYERLTGDDGSVRIAPPRRSEKPIDNSVCYTPECQALGGEIRICAPWVDDCPSDVVK
jgi:hypothetical protein